MISKIKQLFAPKLSKPGEAYIQAMKNDLNRLDNYKWGDIRRRVHDAVSQREWDYIRKLEADLRKEKVAAEIAGLLLSGEVDEEDESDARIQSAAMAQSSITAAMHKKMMEAAMNQNYQQHVHYNKMFREIE